jgi:hypothetical protein
MNSGAPEEWAVPVPTGCTRMVSSHYPLWYLQLFLLFVNMLSIMHIGEVLITWRQHGRENGQISNKIFN